MERNDRLFEACRILFGNDIELSVEFLAYLQEKGVTSAFRKRAKEVHPDRALVSGLSLQRCREEFAALQVACVTLRQHIATRELLSLTHRSHARPPIKSSVHPVYLPEEKLLFGRFLYRMGIIQWRQLIMALAWQKSGRPKIGELGIQLGYLDRKAVLMILKNPVKTDAFGMTAYKMGLLTVAEVRELLLRQKRQEKKIGQFFVEQGLLNRKQLYELLNQCKRHNQWIENITEGPKRG